MEYKIVGEHLLTDRLADELADHLRTLTGRWEVTVEIESTMVVVEGPKKGLAERGHAVTLTNVDTGETESLWVTARPSKIFEEAKGD